MPEASQRDAFGEREIPRISRFAAEQVAGISTAVNALEYSEGYLAGRGHSFKYGVTVSSI